MDPSLLHDLIAQWAERYGLRIVTASGNFRGIIEGVCIDVGVADEMIVAHCFAPSVSLVNQITNDFEGFQNLGRSGVALSSLRGVFSNRRDNNGSCVLELSTDQLRKLTPEDYMEIPSLITKDFRELGATATDMKCAMCSKPSPTQLVIFDELYQVICDSCFTSLELQAAYDPNANAYETNVVWRKVVPMTLVSTIVLSVVWGWLQNPSARMTYFTLFLTPIFGVFAHVCVVMRAAGGINRTLVWSFIISALSWIIIGNVIGFGFRLADIQFHATWLQTIQIYFQHQLPGQWESELWYYVGGIVGIYFTLGRLKPQSKKEMRNRL